MKNLMISALLLKAAGLVALVLALGWVTNQDYQDAQADMERQCMMIEKGYWPREINPHCPAKKEVADHE